MTTLFTAVAFQISANQPWGFHLLKLVEHALVATLLFLLALRLLPTSLPGFLKDRRTELALAAAAVFAVHRVHTEVVNYISAVSSLQAGLFFLAAFFCYVIAFEPKRSKSASRFLLALSPVFFLLSVWSKEEGITLPAMLFLYEVLYKKERDIKKLFWRLLPYIAMAVFFVVARQNLMNPIADSSRGFQSRFSYFITQWRSWLHYWLLFFWPVDLNADNLNFDFSTSLKDWRVWAALLVHISVWAWAYTKRHEHPFYLFAVLWIYITVLPASSVFQLVEAVNEHRSYIPYLLLSLLATLLAAEFLQKKITKKKNFQRIAVTLVCTVVLFLGTGTLLRNEIWSSEETLWRDIYEKNPNSIRAMNVLGVTLYNLGKIEDAEKLLVKCQASSPTYLPCKVHLSMVYAKQKRFLEGRKVLEDGLRINSQYPHINFHYGVYLKDHFGDLDGAEKHLGLVLKLTEGRFFQANVKLAEVWFERGKAKEGLVVLNNLLAIDPNNGDAWDASARGLLLGGDYERAQQIALNLYKLSPNDRHCLILANLFERQKKLEQALEYYEKAVIDNPNTIQGWQGVARVNELLKKPTLEAEQKIAVLKQSNQWVWYSAFFMPGEPWLTLGPTNK